MSKNIQMNIKTSSGYEELYPNIKANNVVDFSGDNPLLTEATSGLYGLSGTAVPDEILKKIKDLIDSINLDINKRSIIETGTYVGTGTSGEESKNKIVFKQKPEILIVHDISQYVGSFTTQTSAGFLYMGDEQQCVSFQSHTSYPINAKLRFEFSGTTLSWYSDSNQDSDDYQANISGHTYKWVAFYL